MGNTIHSLVGSVVRNLVLDRPGIYHALGLHTQIVAHGSYRHWSHSSRAVWYHEQGVCAKLLSGE